jgi:hypothetical protein
MRKLQNQREGVIMPEYTQPEHRQFVLDMEAAGLVVRHFEGRNFYQGPAVEVDDIQDALSRTTVRCQWDHRGLGFIVYPR